MLLIKLLRLENFLIACRLHCEKDLVIPLLRFCVFLVTRKIVMRLLGLVSYVQMLLLQSQRRLVELQSKQIMRRWLNDSIRH